jgi:hypothetical protein
MAEIPRWTGVTGPRRGRTGVHKQARQRAYVIGKAIKT